MTRIASTTGELVATFEALEGAPERPSPQRSLVSNYPDDGGGSTPSGPRPPGSTAAPPALPVSPSRELPVVAQSQGDSNACGTTALAEVLTYWGQPTTHQQVDAAIRHFDLFTAPDAIVAYARAHGMRSELKADASLEDLAHQVDLGAPPIVLIDPDGGQNANLHYVTVCGYHRDAAGQITDLVCADSGYPGEHRVISARDFSRQWGQLELGGVPTGLNNVMISTVPADGRSVVGGDGVTRSAGDLQLPTSDLLGTLRSLAARGLASAVTAVTTLADAVLTGLERLWHAIIGRP
jgi:Peptidase_C39 like family